MQVLSLFDGISCGQVALQRAGFITSNYYASEIEQSAIKVTQSNFPETIQLGDVKNVRSLVEANAFGKIDLLMGGSPCQGFSKMGKNKGFNDVRSQLVFDFIAIKNFLKPKYFLLENVKMKKNDENIITLLTGVEPVEICSSLFSAQRRKRKYWTNIKINEIVDAQIHVLSIIDYFNQTPNSKSFHTWWEKNKDFQISKGYSTIVNFVDKAQTLMRRSPANWNANLYQINEKSYRFLSVNECEKLQTLPIGYCKNIKESKAYEALGNGWTVDVIAHILKGMTF